MHLPKKDENKILEDIADRILRYDTKASPLHVLFEKRFPTERQETLSRLTGRPWKDFIP